MGKKQKLRRAARRDKIAAIIVGVILAVGSLLPVSANLLGRTGYITEITRTERVGGRLDEPGNPNAYWWSVGYKFRMENGEIETGSIQVKGDAVSSKSGLRVGSPVRYLVLIPAYNTPGEGTLDGSTVMYLLCAAFGVFIFMLGVRKPKPNKTPAQCSREYRAAKAAREIPQAPAVGPDWDSFEYDDDTPITTAEMDELAAIATDEEYQDEFDLINATDEGAAFFRKILAILRWRRANGQ